MAELKASLEELTADAERFRDFKANFPGAIFVYDLKPDGTDAVRYISEKCLDIWEVDSQEVLDDARPLWSIIAPDDVPVMRDSIQKSASEMGPWHCRWRVVTRSNKEKWLEGWGKPKRLNDGTVRWNSMILDVTNYRQAEIALEASRESLATARHLESIGVLSSGIAHDFNNLLTVIAGHTELIRLKSGHDKNLEPIIESLTGAIERGSSLATNLLSYSRRHQSIEEVIDLKLFAKQFEELCRRTLSPRIHFSSSLKINIEPIRIDVGMLQSSVLNLVLNSRDAVAQEGDISVGYDFDSSTRNLIVSVADNGVGISSEARAHLFEPFFTTKPLGQGTGLGLSMVRSFVEKYGGHVDIESEPGKGTTVSLHFPIASLRSSISYNDGSVSNGGKNSTQVSKHDLAEQTEKRPERILVVEDDPDILEMMLDVLQLYGYSPIGAADADSALVHIEGREQIDALISDVMMPGSMLGTDLVEKARAVRPGLPIVLMSGYVDVSRGSPLDVLEKYPDVAFLQKPARPDEIVAQLKKSIRSQKP